MSVLPAEERKDRGKTRVRIRGGDNTPHFPAGDDSDISELEQRVRLVCGDGNEVHTPMGE